MSNRVIHNWHTNIDCIVSYRIRTAQYPAYRLSNVRLVTTICACDTQSHSCATSIRLSSYHFIASSIVLLCVSGFGREGDFNVLVIELLGPSLEDMFNVRAKNKIISNIFDECMMLIPVNLIVLLFFASFVIANFLSRLFSCSPINSYVEQRERVKWMGRVGQSYSSFIR